MLKKIGLWMSTTLFTSSVLGLIVSATFLSLLRPDNIKTWVDKSGAYSSLPGSLIDEAGKKQATEGSSDGVSFTEPGVKDAAKKALSPSFLQSSTEQIVDGSFKWLDGKTDKPDFSIDVQSAKQTFVDELGNYYLKRYEALPACAASSAPTSTEIDKIDCKPAGTFDAAAAIEAQKAQLLENKDFLPETTLTADNFVGDGSKPAYEDKVIPNIYKLVKLLPLVLSGLAIMTALGIVFLSSSRKAGLHKIGWRLTILGGLSVLITGLSVFGLTKVRSLALQQGSDAAVTIYKDILTKGLDAVRSDLIMTGAIISGVILLLGIVVLVATRGSKDKPEVEPTDSSKLEKSKPEPTVEEPAKPTPKPIEPKTAPTLPKSPSKPKRTLIQ